MKKYFQHISGFILTIAIVFILTGVLSPQTTYALECPPGQIVVVNEDTGEPSCVSVNTSSEPGPKTSSPSVISQLLGFGTDILLTPLGWLAIMVLQIATLITWLGGTVLNYIVQFTIVEMKFNLDKASSISTAWGVIRDVANMGFIFILLYAAIQTILGIGSDVKKLIVNIIIVAILINFSLFFTKVVIDASNVLSIAFYDAIAPGSLTAGVTTEPTKIIGIAGKLMEPLYITSLWEAAEVKAFEGKKTIIIGVMGTVVALIAAFIFFAIAIMFVIRFVVLIFVLILSPLAFLGFILPQLKSEKDKWIQALLGQAFFAPIYFMLTWIVILVAQGLYKKPAGASMEKVFIGDVSADGTSMTPPSPDEIGILLNFIIVIVMLIASLIIAKQWADKAGHGVPGLTKWAMGAAGGATLGMAGRMGRGTIGRVGQAVADNRWLKERAPDSRAARLALAAGKKTGAAGFDIRGTALGGPLEAGKASGKGGYQAEREEKIKKRMQFAEKDMNDTVTGAHVESEMANRRWNVDARDRDWLQNTVGLSPAQIAAINTGGASKNQIERHGITARQAEDMRKRVQRELIAPLDIVNEERRTRYLHNLSQTHWYTPNLYSGVSDDAQAARLMREGKKSKSPKDSLIEAIEEYQKTTASTPPSSPASLPSPTSPTPPTSGTATP